MAARRKETRIQIPFYQSISSSPVCSNTATSIFERLVYYARLTRELHRTLRGPRNDNILLGDPTTTTSCIWRNLQPGSIIRQSLPTHLIMFRIGRRTFANGHLAAAASRMCQSQRHWPAASIAPVSWAIIIFQT